MTYTTDDASRRDLWILRTGHNPDLSVARETSSGGYYRAVGTPLPSEWRALSFPDLLASASELVGFPLPSEAAWSTYHGSVWRARLTSPVTVLEAFNGRIAGLPTTRERCRSVDFRVPRIRAAR